MEIFNIQVDETYLDTAGGNPSVVHIKMIDAGGFGEVHEVE